MKKNISIFLILCITAGSIHLNEFSKIPVMMNHYKEHRTNNPSLTFLTFLFNHYIQDKKPESEKDKKENSQLPFKLLQSFYSHFIPFTFENNPVQVADNFVVKVFVPFKETKISSAFSSIWQPPKAG